CAGLGFRAAALLRVELDRLLFGVLPADGGKPHAADQDRRHQRCRHHVDPGDGRRRDRLARDVLGGAPDLPALPVRAAGAVLAGAEGRAEESPAAARDAGRAVTTAAYVTISASSIRFPDGSAKKASLRLMASSLNGSVTILTPRALSSATAFSMSGTLMQKWW